MPQTRSASRLLCSASRRQTARLRKAALRHACWHEQRDAAMWGNLQPPALHAGGFMGLPTAAGLQAAPGAAHASLWSLPHQLPATGLPPVNSSLIPGFTGGLPGMQFGSAPGLMPTTLSSPPPPGFGTMPGVGSNSIFGAAVPGSTFSMPQTSTAGSGSFAEAKNADAAKGVIRGAPTTVPATKSQLDSSRSSSPPNKRAKQIGSLLAAYAEDEGSASEDEEKREEPKCEEASGQAKVTVVKCAWEPWQDVLVPRRRHGLVVGRPPSELVGSWPREASEYPAGHGPADPPGCCRPQCTCMDGTRRPEEWELRKSWLDGDGDGGDGQSRSKAAAKALQGFSGQAFVLARGRNSKQHFLEAVSSTSTTSRAPGGESQSGKPASCVEELRSVSCELEAISELAAASMREALGDVGLGDVMGSGLRVPVAALLPPGKLYEPFRVEAASSSNAGLSARGTEVCASGEMPVLHGAVQELRLLLPEGEVLVSACRIGSGGLEGRASSTAQIAKKIAALPWQFRMPLLEALSGVWDMTSGTTRQGIQLREWLRVMERVHLQARSAASAHVVDLGPQGAEALRIPSSSSTAPAPGIAIWGTQPGVQLGSAAVSLPGLLPPPGFQSGFLPTLPGPPPFSLAPPSGFPPAFQSGMELPTGFPPGFPPSMELPAGTMPAGPQWTGLTAPAPFENMSKATFPTLAMGSPPGPPPGVPPKQPQGPPGPPPGAPPGAPPVSFKSPPLKSPPPPWREPSYSKAAPAPQVQAESPLPIRDPTLLQTVKSMAAPPPAIDSEFAQKRAALGLATTAKAGREDWRRSSQAGGSEWAMETPSGVSTPSI